MPTDIKAAYDSLLTSSKLDSLLDKAREQTEKLSQTEESRPTDVVEQINTEVQELNQKQAHARQDLEELLRERAEKRAEKAAIAAHITRVAVKLVS